jgi:hypothetical protein
MPSSSRPVPPLLAAHLVTSPEVSGRRQPLIAALHHAVAPLTMTGRLEPVLGFEQDAVKAALSAPQQTPPLVDLDATHMDDVSMRPLVHSLHVRQISNTFKHAEALRLIAALPVPAQQGPGVPPHPRFGLVLEDDAVFSATMVQALTRAARDAPADADLVFLGLPSTRTIPPEEDRSEFDDPLSLYANHVIPACESYLVTPAAAGRIAALLFPLRLNTTGQLTYILRKGAAAKAYVAVPNAFVDGSKIGIVTSSVDGNNQLLWNQAYCRMDAILRQVPKDGAYTEAMQAQFEAVWENEQQFKEHPDVLVLRADHLARSGRRREAEDTYERALGLYDRDACVVNNGSEFLKRYMAIFGEEEGGARVV